MHDCPDRTCTISFRNCSQSLELFCKFTQQCLPFAKLLKMENQNILRIVLSLAIIAAFFLPMYNDSVYGVAISAWQILTGSFSNISGAKDLPSSRLVLITCLLIVLVCILIIFIFSVLRRSTSVILNLLPLFSIIGLIIFSMTQSKDNVGNTLQAFGTGFYIMFLGSFLLPFASITVTTNPTNS